ncbi:FAD-dependent oxidoreductase [Conexibacter sp. JD483]|uniref:NAD(P)/FAD-dependent oxidoreductase n=1 Tax=unclassified Conexibacter TaxID=2627773 RepID=UPI00272076CD|nr:MULTISPECIES: FAD-dependent oxidoreductase [unclassified Conexibacter]MDO8187659.1 FAD-dependent oxidoreductase [Conexibacter sp. CPCC 205706]MDO8199844.1 FAD-dependent oxidoreductase [Conexibacter sp. CPCC 205762]MDR9370221.1 FAD-dependent oxidoreductase [Conexibacter sp. JD483]
MGRFQQPDTAVVVGAGVAGLWSAIALARRGVQVTVVDGGTVGSGASWGNAGWLCPSQAGPLPEPGQVAYGLRSLGDRRSALYMAPTSIPGMALWLAAFARRCNARDYAAGVRAMSHLGYPSFALVSALLAEEEDAPAAERSGLMVAAAEAEPVRAFLAAVAPLREQGHELPGRLLDDDELGELEPGLVGRAKAVHVADHWQVDPAHFLAYLARRARALGVEIRERWEVSGFELAGGRVRAVRCLNATIETDALVVAAGPASRGLAAELGVHIPVIAGKGYSLDVVEPEWMPRHALMYMDTHLAVSPYRDRLRIAGTMEFSRRRSPDPERVRALEDVARDTFGDWRSAAPAWMGARPIVPDGLPVVGRLPGLGNAYAATGYSMLGMTISAASGELLAEEITSGRKPAIAGPFDPARFSRLLRTIARRRAGRRTTAAT